MGKIYNEAGEIEAALHHHRQTLALFRRLGYSAGEAATLNNIGYNQARLKQYPKALVACREALALALLLEIGPAGASTTGCHVHFPAIAVGQPRLLCSTPAAQGIAQAVQAMRLAVAVAQLPGERTTRPSDAIARR
jgi:tetratricopeptide (TPR) repeat protein